LLLCRCIKAPGVGGEVGRAGCGGVAEEACVGKAVVQMTSSTGGPGCTGDHRAQEYDQLGLLNAVVPVGEELAEQRDLAPISGTRPVL
jgi:hypothetical protein